MRYAITKSCSIDAAMISEICDACGTESCDASGIKTCQSCAGQSLAMRLASRLASPVPVHAVHIEQWGSQCEGPWKHQRSAVERGRSKLPRQKLLPSVLPSATPLSTSTAGRNSTYSHGYRTIGNCLDKSCVAPVGQLDPGLSSEDSCLKLNRVLLRYMCPLIQPAAVIAKESSARCALSWTLRLNSTTG